MATVQRRYCLRSAAHPPPSDSPQPPPPRSSAAVGCFCVASRVGRRRRYLPHRLGLSPPPAAPSPPPGVPRDVAAAHRVRSGRAVATASLRGAPPTRAQQSTSPQNPAAPTRPPRPRRTDAALAATGKGQRVTRRATRGPPIARRPLCHDSAWHRGSTASPPARLPACPACHPPDRPRGARGGHVDPVPTGGTSC